jgi:hypothetical protein
MPTQAPQHAPSTLPDSIQKDHSLHEMSTGEDDDVKLQRASAALIADFERLLPHLLRKRRNGLVTVKLMHAACCLVRFPCG